MCINWYHKILGVVLVIYVSYICLYMLAVNCGIVCYSVYSVHSVHSVYSVYRLLSIAAAAAVVVVVVVAVVVVTENLKLRTPSCTYVHTTVAYEYLMIKFF